MRTSDDFRELLLDSFAFDVGDPALLLQTVLKKGHVVFLHSTTIKLTALETAKKIISIINLSQNSENPACNNNPSALKASVNRLMKRVKSLKKSLTRNWQLMVDLLNEEFALPMPLTSAVNVQSHQGVLSSDPVATTSSSSSLHQTVLPSKQLKTDCLKCENRRKVQRTLVTAQTKLKSDIKAMKTKSRLNHHLHQSLKRKCQVEVNLREERRILKRGCFVKDAKISQLVQENGRLKASSIQQDLKRIRRSNKQTAGES